MSAVYLLGQRFSGTFIASFRGAATSTLNLRINRPVLYTSFRDRDKIDGTVRIRLEIPQETTN